MIKSIFIALLLVGSAYCRPRVVNGTDAEINNFPYIISLRSSSGSHSCGGSIISPRWILTAAHCVDGGSASSMSIQYGVTNISSSGPNVQRVRSIIVHEKYAPSRNYANDVALLKLENRLPINGTNIGIINLPRQGFEVPGGDIGKLIGWGRNATGGPIQTHLQQVDLKIYSDKECNERHQGQTTADHICGGVDEGGKGQCNGDSGGPLSYMGVQIGIVSWSQKPCTIAPYPGVYTKVSHYTNWIIDNISD